MSSLSYMIDNLVRDFRDDKLSKTVSCPSDVREANPMVIYTRTPHYKL